MDAKLIGFAGKQGAGKDYMFEHFKGALGIDGKVVRRMAFADGVRREVEEVLTSGNPAVRKLNAVWDKPYPAEIRWLLQQWGTELRRNQDPDYWVNRGMEYLEAADKNADLWCVTDVRFENEAKAIQAAGGLVVLVLAEDSVRAKRLGLPVAELKRRSQHASEVMDFFYDASVMNTGSHDPVVDDKIWEYLNG